MDHAVDYHHLYGGGLPAPEFLFRDDFITADTAPLGTPRTAEPGPGSLVVVENDGQFSIASDKLSVPAQSTPAWGDLSLYGGADIPRSAGLGVFFLANFSTLSTHLFAFGSGNGSYETIQAFGYSAFGIEVYDNNNIQRVRVSLSTDTDTILAIILRPTGAFYIKDGELIAVGFDSTQANVRAKTLNYNSAFTLDYIRAAQLAGDFATDSLQSYSDATPTADDEATVHQDSLHYIQWTVGSSETFELRFRRVDDDNCLILRCSEAANTIALIKREAASETVLASTSHTWTPSTTYRIGLRHNGSTLATFVYGFGTNTSVTNSYNSSITNVKIAGAASLANWDVFDATLSGENLTEYTKYSNPFLA